MTDDLQVGDGDVEQDAARPHRLRQLPVRAEITGVSTIRWCAVSGGLCGMAGSVVMPELVNISDVLDGHIVLYRQCLDRVPQWVCPEAAGRQSGRHFLDRASRQPDFFRYRSARSATAFVPLSTASPKARASASCT